MKMFSLTEQKTKRSWNRHIKSSFPNFEGNLNGNKVPLLFFMLTSSFHSLFKEIPMTKRAKLISLRFFTLFIFLCAIRFSGFVTEFWYTLLYMNGKWDQSHQLKSQKTMVQVRSRFTSRKTKNHSIIYKKKYFSDKSGMEITPFPLQYSFTTIIRVYTTHDTRTNYAETVTEKPIHRKILNDKHLSFTVHASRFCFVKQWQQFFSCRKHEQCMN